jgi:alpha/beta superfamily hydrolase
MVVKGQFLERPTLIPTEHGLVLEGISHRGAKRPLLLVLPPTPNEGGGMDHVVSAELVYAAASAGFPTLRFNYRGVGASQGSREATPKTLMADAWAAYSLAVDNADGGSPVIATLGASDAIAWQLSKDHPVAGLLFINPTLVDPDEMAQLPFAVGAVVAELDASVPRAEWAAALETHGQVLTVVPGTDRGYQRNLLMVGKAGAAFLTRASQSLAIL